MSRKISYLSRENAGIRYVSATLKRAGYDCYCIFLRDWRHNLLEIPSEKEFSMVMELVREKQPDLIGIGFMSSLCRNLRPPRPTGWR